MRGAGYPPNPWSRNSLAGRTGMTIRTAGRHRGAFLAAPDRIPGARGRRGRGRRATTATARARAGRSTTSRSPWRRGRRARRWCRSSHDLGVVRCGGIVGRILLRGTGEADAIRAGQLHPHDEHDARRRDRGAVDAARRPCRPSRLTIPEGYRLTQIAERVQEELDIPAGAVPDRGARASDWSLAPYLPAGTADRGVPVPRDVPVREGRRRRRT